MYSKFIQKCKFRLRNAQLTLYQVSIEMLVWIPLKGSISGIIYCYLQSCTHHDSYPSSPPHHPLNPFNLCYSPLPPNPYTHHSVPYKSIHHCMPHCTSILTPSYTLHSCGHLLPTGCMRAAGLLSGQTSPWWRRMMTTRQLLPISSAHRACSGGCPSLNPFAQPHWLRAPTRQRRLQWPAGEAGA